MCLLDGKEMNHIETMQAHMRSQMKNLTGLDDTSGIELVGLIRMLTHLCEAVETRDCGENGLSGPRWGLLMRLMAEEMRGNPQGVTPTSLSRFQSVSKNTISALLRGLEEQGFIRRALDPADYRIFRIQLTEAGRELVQSMASQRIGHLNQMVSGLSAAEREQLVALLAKLYRSVLDRSNTSKTEFHGG
jgi:DNA-binding MarR family transcriptional regulator